MSRRSQNSSKELHSTVIPATWVMTTLHDVTLPRGIKVKPSEMEDAPFIGLKDIEAHTLRLLGTGQARDFKSSGSYFDRGDVLYGRLRPYLNKVYQPDFNGIASGEFIVFPNQSHLNNTYLMYFLNQSEFVSYATRLNAGDRPRVDFDQLANYPFPLPPLAEQGRIVAEIEKQFTRLDAAEAALRRVEVNLKRYRASVLKAACEGKLVPTEAELAEAEGRDYEHAEQLLERILGERRAQWESQEKRRGVYKDPVPLDTTNLSALPKGWQYTSIEPLLSLSRAGVKTGPFGSLLKKHEHRESGVPVFGIENIRGMDFVPGNKIFVTFEKALSLSAYDIQAGDILISRSGTVGHSCVVPNEIGEARLSTNLIRLSLEDQYIMPRYLCLLLNGSPTVLGQVSVLCSGSTRDFLNRKIIMSLAFPLPPFAEQRRIIAEVDRLHSIIQQCESTVKISLKRVGRLRQSILKKAFCGRLVPQDPDDRPASKLLERIKDEREAARSSKASRPRPTRRRSRK